MDAFRRKGWQPADFDGQASVYIVNTCTVTSAADQKSRKAIRGAKKRNPGSLLVVTGCYAESGKRALEGLGEIDLALGNAMKEKLPELVEKALAERAAAQGAAAEKAAAPKTKAVPGALSGIDRTRATLKIQDGCRQYCSYCIVPYVRGELRSMPRVEVIRRVAVMEAAGYREVVLLGIHLGAYGQGVYGAEAWGEEAGSVKAYNVDAGGCETAGTAVGEDERLAGLLEELLRSYPGIRFRLGSLEPMEASDKLIALIGAYPNACKHLHLPLQSGSDKILQAMNRPYSADGYRAKVQAIRDLIPDIALTTDVMVGFPGEGEEEFRQSLAFAEEMAFSRTHVFAYSRRSGTPAAGMPGQVPKGVKDRRSEEFIRAGEVMKQNYGDGWIGRRLEALMEEELGGGTWSGHSGNYLEVTYTPGQGDRGYADDIKGMVLPLRIAGRSKVKPGAWQGIIG